jgi:hypothetical protein
MKIKYNDRLESIFLRQKSLFLRLNSQFLRYYFKTACFGCIYYQTQHL